MASILLNKLSQNKIHAMQMHYAQMICVNTDTVGYANLASSSPIIQQAGFHYSPCMHVRGGTVK